MDDKLRLEIGEHLRDIGSTLKYGCGNHSCVLVKPVGMGTNGSCHCRDIPASLRALADALQRGE